MRVQSWIPIIFSIFILSACVYVSKSAKRVQEPIPTPDRLHQYLNDELNRLPPGSPAARSVLNDIQKLRRKKAKLKAGQDFPKSLLEAFAEIKTAPDGSTYQPSYKQRALVQAKRHLKASKRSFAWEEIGPGNVSGRTRAILVDPSDPSTNTWFAATIGGGIWKTTDSGATWRDMTPNLATLSTSCLAQSKSNPDVFYAGTGMGYGRVVELNGSGIWKSVDHGETWFQLESTADGQLLQAINRIVVDPNNENVLLACSNNSFSHLGPKGGDRKSGIFRSVDGGESWTQVFDPDDLFGTATDNRVQQIVADPSNFNNLYATVNEVGVVRSTNAGLTWSVSANYFAQASDIGNPTGGGIGLAGISVRTEIAVAPSDPTRLYAAVERPRGIADLYMSFNRGASWVLINDTGNDPNWFNSFGVSGANGAYTAGWFDNCLAVHPYNPDIVFVGGVNIYRLNVNVSNRTRTSTQLTSWLQSIPGVSPVHSDHHWLEVVPLNPATQSFRIVNGNDGGVGVSDDSGATWRQLQGLRSSQFYGVTKRPGSNQYAAGAQDNGTWLSSVDPNLSSAWTSVVGGDGFETVWNSQDPNLLLATIQFNFIVRSTDGGANFAVSSLPAHGLNPFITKIAYGQTDPDLIFTLGQAGIMRSDDFGLTWTLTPVNNNWLGHRPFDNVEVSSIDPRVVWISSRLDIDPATGRRGGVHVSRDSGFSYQDVSSSLYPFGVGEASGLTPDPVNPARAYLAFSAPGLPKLLRTDDWGQTWEDLSNFQNGSSNNGFPDVGVFDILVMPYNPDHLIVGTEIGLFSSEDAGQTWMYDDALGHVSVFQLSIWEEQVLAATQGRGLWRAVVPELATYERPEVTMVPRIAKAQMTPAGNLAVDLDLRSAYDGVRVFINDVETEVLAGNDQPLSKTFLYPVDRDQTVAVRIEALKNGEVYTAPPKTAQLFNREPINTYSTSFANIDPDDLILSGFTVTTPSGFPGPGLVTTNPYPINSSMTAMIKRPILVPESGAVVRYRDIAIVEAGTGSGQFGDPQFWDYVVVEASRDGLNWIPLRDGYDARLNSAWLAAYNNGGGADPSMFVDHEYDLGRQFQPGEQIFIRWRLFSDAAVNAWGWMIDDIQIFPGNTDQIQALEHRTILPWISQNENFQSVLVLNNTGTQKARYILTARRDSGSGERLAIKTLEAGEFAAMDAGALFKGMEAGRGAVVEVVADQAALKARWVTNNLTAATGRSPSQGVGIEMDRVRSGRSHRAGNKLVFHYLPGGDGLFAAPVLVNLGDQPTDVRLTFYSADGQIRRDDRTTVVQLEPNRPFTRLVREWFPENSEDLSLIAESDGQPISGVVFVFNQQGETAIGNASALLTAGNAVSRLLFSWVSNNEDFESILVANNTGDQEGEIVLTAQRASGESETVTRRIAAGGFLAEQAGSLFPALGDGSGYSVTLDADGDGWYGAWVTNNLRAASGRSPSQGVAVRLSEQVDENNDRVGRKILFGYLPVENQFTSAPVIINASGQPTDVELSFYNRAGVLVHQQTLTSLAPGIPFAQTIEQYLPGAAEDLYLVAESSAGAITGVAFIFNGGAEPAVGNVTVLE